MRRFYYNTLRTNGIKGISLNLLVVLANVLILYLFSTNVLTTDNKGLFITVVILIIVLVGLFYFRIIKSFEQVVERSSDGHIVTYFKVGLVKVNHQTHGKFVESTLEQDSKRYYCLIIMTVNEKLILEKHPTLDKANERLEALRLNVG